MVHLTEASIEQKLSEIESHILNGQSGVGMITNTTWMGVTVEWQPLPLKSGGTLKRKHAYGKLIYTYNNEKLTREQAVKEIAKPPALRRALIEATTFVECSMCGFIANGKDALDPYTGHSWDYDKGIPIIKPRWGFMFYKLTDDIEHPECLSICPKCMDRIASGEFRHTDDEDDRE